jgi:transcriptional regulator with GAF, ATPase, and Fis domain
MRVQALRLTARRHLARGELSLAGSALAAAAKAIDALEPHEQREPTGALFVDRARLQLAIGDLAQCARNLDAAAATRPTAMRLARIRLVRMQCDQLACCEETKRRVARLMRLFMQPRMPRLLRLRARYWFEPESRRSAELAAFIDRFGESALAGRIAAAPGPMTASHFRALLQMSHEAGDECALLGRICGYVRRELDAAYVAIHGAPGGRPSLAWSGQTRLASSTLVERVGSTGQFVSPITAADAIESGVPVRAHDQTVGVLVCRWVIDSTVDRSLTAMLLPAAADAAAPHVQAVLDRAGFVAVPATPGRSLSSPTSRATPTSGPTSTPSAPPMTSLLGVSAPIVTLRETIVRTADAPFNVLIEGESGSGKELVARALHEHSVRRIRRFCAVNCAALSDELVEAELFGHARGAFTGALAERIGLFEEAHEGTLFLDEVGELSTRAQAKLLRAIQDGEIRRIGENLPRRVQPRIVAATNRPLRDEAAAGRFRPDLLYRLDVVRIVVPPLRERLEDIPMLARAFWQQALARTRSRATLDPETLAALARYDWPGNVRELQNVIARLAVQAPARGRVTPMALPAPIHPTVSMSTSMPLDRARRAFEEQFVRGAIARAGGQLGPAARDLGLTRQGLTKLLARLGIATADQPAAAPSREMGSDG